MRLFSAIAAVRKRIAANGWTTTPHAGRTPRSDARLLARDRVQVDRAVDEDQPQHGEPHDQLVGDHLRAGAQRAEQRELVRRRPSGEHRADDREPAEREDDEQPRVDARDLHRIRAIAEPCGDRRQALEQRRRHEHPAERNDGEHQQHRREHDPRRERIGEAVVGVRPEILLQHHLDAVGEPVKQAEPHELHLRERDAHVRAVRADPVGHDRRLLALDPRQHRAEEQEDGDRVADEDRGDDEVLDHAGAPSVSAAAIVANSASASITVAGFGKHAEKALTTPSKFV